MGSPEKNRRVLCLLGTGMHFLIMPLAAQLLT